MNDYTEKDTCTINVFGAYGSGVEASFQVHKNIPYKIKRKLGRELMGITTFLDRDSEEKGMCYLLGKNSLVIKELLSDEDYQKQLNKEDLEMEYYQKLKDDEEDKELFELQALVEKLRADRSARREASVGGASLIHDKEK